MKRSLILAVVLLGVVQVIAQIEKKESEQQKKQLEKSPRFYFKEAKEEAKRGTADVVKKALIYLGLAEQQKELGKKEFGKVGTI